MVPYPVRQDGGERHPAAVAALLDKHKAGDRSLTHYTAPSGRPAFAVSFALGGRTYRVAVETLDAPKVPADVRVRQAERAAFYALKSALEMATVFFPAERVLFPFLVVGGQVVYDAVAPALPAATDARGVARMMLGPAAG